MWCCRLTNRNTIVVAAVRQMLSRISTGATSAGLQAHLAVVGQGVPSDVSALHCSVDLCHGGGVWAADADALGAVEEKRHQP